MSTVPRIPLCREDEQRHIMETLIQTGILATRETHRREKGIIAFDETYYTNFDLDFQQLESQDNEHIIDRIAQYLRQYYITEEPEVYSVLNPIDFKADRYTMSVFRKITTKLKLSVVQKRRISNNKKLIILAPLYSQSLKHFILNYNNAIHSVIMLMAPASAYLLNALHLKPEQVHVLVSADSLAHISREIRHLMISGL